MEPTLPRRVVLARRHRNSPTRSEALLWESLRRRQIDAFQFRRQYPVGPYFADFFCVHARLAVEVDGESHRGRERRDRLRDTFFRRRGITVLRFTNDQVEEDTVRVIDAIRAALRASSPLTQ